MARSLQSRKSVTRTADRARVRWRGGFERTTDPTIESDPAAAQHDRTIVGPAQQASLRRQLPPSAVGVPEPDDTCALGSDVGPVRRNEEPTAVLSNPPAARSSCRSPCPNGAPCRGPAWCTPRRGHRASDGGSVERRAIGRPGEVAGELVSPVREWRRDPSSAATTIGSPSRPHRDTGLVGIARPSGEMTWGRAHHRRRSTTGCPARLGPDRRRPYRRPRRCR